MTNRKKWLIVFLIAVLVPVLLTVLYPVLGTSVNTLSIAAPIVATLFFGFKTGVLISIFSWVTAIITFTQISELSTSEGIVRAPIPILVTLALCFGAGRLRVYLKQRKRAEKALKASEERYRLIFEHSADGIVLLDEDGTVLDANPRVKTHVGYSPKDLIGRKFQHLGLFSDAAIGEIAEIVDSRRSDSTKELETEGTDKAGRQIYLQLSISRIAARANPARWICLLKNTTERRDMMARLQEAQKMKAIGRLAGGVAHDLNNILNAIIGSAHAHKYEISRFEGRFEDLENITSACNRGAKLTQNLLGFARKSNVTKKELFSLNTCIKNVLSIINRTSLKNIRHETELEENLPLISGDQNQIENALMNICINAQDAMAQNGVLKTETHSVNGSVWIRVSDDGCGMDEETRRRVFEPFFTTKPVGKGTGLGLSMVYGVTQNHNGTIDIDSTLDKGTAVTLMFPKASNQAAIVAEPEPDRFENDGSANLLSSKTVLLVDDEPLVLRAGTRMLQTLGCHVLAARNGKEAIELCRKGDHDIALVILDLIMPDMDGTATLKRLREINPSLPVLLASGYAQEFERICALNVYADCGFLPKPYHPDSLIAAARTVLQIKAA